MSGLMEKLLPKAAAANLTLVLPEGHDPRVIKAAKIITERKLATSKSSTGRRPPISTTWPPSCSNAARPKA